LNAAAVAFRCHERAVLVAPETAGAVDIPAYILTSFGRDLLRLGTSFQSRPTYLRAFGGMLKSQLDGSVEITLRGPISRGPIWTESFEVEEIIGNSDEL
jgi:hypothetical protein